MNRILERYVLIYGTDTCYDVQEGIVMQVKNLRLALTNDYANLWLKLCEFVAEVAAAAYGLAVPVGIRSFVHLL